MFRASLARNLRARGADYRVLLALSIPLVIGSFSDIATGIVDTALVGRYSVEALAAVGVATTVFFSFVIIIVGASIGQSVMTSQNYGANRLERVGLVLQNSLLLYGGMAAAAAVACILGARFLAQIFTDDALIVQGITEYLQIRGAGIVFIVLELVFVNLFAANRETKWALYSGVFLNVVNIALSYPLIYGAGPFPELGVAGSAWGGLAADLSGFLFVLAVFLFKGYRQSVWPGRFNFSPYIMRELIKVSAPTLVSVLNLHISLLLSLEFMGRLGVDELAAGRVAQQYVFSAFALLYAFHAAGQIMAGRLVGARDWSAVSRLHRRNAELAVGVYLIPMIIFLIFPQWVLAVFTDFEQVSNIALTPLRVGILVCLLIAWALNNVTFMRGLGKTRWDLIIVLITIWLIHIPTMYLLTFPAGLGLVGIFISELIFWSSRGAFMQFMLWRLFRRAPLQPIDKAV